MNLKRLYIFIIIFIFIINSLFSQQHSVNDITKYKGWYKVKIEFFQSGNIMYYITQCYPSGDEYEVTGIEREKLPLYLKVLCMGMADEVMKDSFDFNEMSFDEDVFFMQLSSFSLTFTFVFNFSKSESEILNEIGNETVNKYRYRRWQ